MRSGSIAASRSLSVKWKKNAEGEASAKKRQNRDGECHIGDSYADLWYVRVHRDDCISPRRRHTYGHLRKISTDLLEREKGRWHSVRPPGAEQGYATTVGLAKSLPASFPSSLQRPRSEQCDGRQVETARYSLPSFPRFLLFRGRCEVLFLRRLPGAISHVPVVAVVVVTCLSHVTVFFAWRPAGFYFVPFSFHLRSHPTGN